MSKKRVDRWLPKCVKFLVKHIFRVEIKGQYTGGRQNGHAKTLIIANHASFLDGLLLALFLPESPVFVVHSHTAQLPFFRFFLRYIDYVTVEPSHPMAMKQVLKLLDEGRPVVIFPEGRITVTGALMKIYAGAAFAATKSEATIIPVQINGAKHSYFSRLRGVFNRRLFPKLHVTIFPATNILENPALPESLRRQDANAQLHQLMMTMAVESRQPMAIYDMLLFARRMHGKNRLVYEDGVTDALTFDSLVKKSVALSTLLNKHPLSKRVGVLLPNSNACVLTFYALQYMDKVPAMLNYTAGNLAIKTGLIATQANTVITSRAFIEKAGLEGLVSALGDYRLIYLEDLRGSISIADKCKIAVKQHFPHVTMQKQHPEDEAVVLFTSGSEGLPKGVVHHHDSLLTNVAQIKAVFDLNPHDKFMICLPVFHVFGLTTGFLLPVSAGASAFLYPNPLHYRAIPEIIYDRNCTVLLSTSTFLAGYARVADQYDFHSLRYVISGAEKLSPSVVQTYHEKFGIRVLEGYGATETAPVIAVNTMMAYQNASVGRLLPSIKAELEPVPGIEPVDDPSHQTGRLVIYADNVMQGYLRADNPGEVEYSPAVDGKRVYDTGDIVELDHQGYVHIRGRVKRFAKIAGEMVSLDSVENIAEHASEEAHHAVIRVPDAKKGEALVLFTTDASLDRKQLQKSAHQLGMPELSVPRDIRHCDKIPVFASGKTNYPELMKMLK